LCAGIHAPGMATGRDRVWAAALAVGINTDEFRVDDVLGELGDDPPSRKTVQRTLRGMTETGVLSHAPSSPWYSCRWSSTPADDEPEPSVDAETIAASIEPPGLSDGVIETRRRALADVLEAIDREGRLSKSGCLGAVDGLAEFESPDSLWRNWIYPALSELQDEGVVEWGDGGWRLTDDEE